MACPDVMVCDRNCVTSSAELSYDDATTFSKASANSAKFLLTNRKEMRTCVCVCVCVYGETGGRRVT